ncbi:hypothetical protein P168DRAFT_139169 [Aspergillus campestris IBT 28561]|uniref:Uncharacterized protein n=1 Tax=Aspergillus campestris (strain IBT 28561) TaxID=1392248 RepID=A0A2I1D4I0_ASPC2|nr:uncharacterized protein P168DRAFT_139169 [Aspergillus campestris IBT 28561]PKY04782.1 hypothetical protein P168DRAFT_139169 [Aspergillus campestris IBT 28561]
MGDRRLGGSQDLIGLKLRLASIQISRMGLAGPSPTRPPGTREANTERRWLTTGLLIGVTLRREIVTFDSNLAHGQRWRLTVLAPGPRGGHQ